MLALTPRCDSILFATEALAVSGLRYINQLGIKVPEELGIVSFEESQAFELFRCPITHGKQPLDRIAGIAIHLLKKAMNGAQWGEQTIVRADLHVGESCGEKWGPGPGGKREWRRRATDWLSDDGLAGSRDGA